MCLSPDRTLMMSYLQETELVMQDVVTGHGIYTVHSTSRTIRPECFSNDNEYIGCGTVDGGVIVYKMPCNEQFYANEGPYFHPKSSRNALSIRG